MMTTGRRGILTLLLALLCGIAACSGNSHKADPKLNDPPPEGEAQPAIPSGPPLVRQNNGDAPAQPPAEEGGTAVTRAQLDSFLDRGPSYVLTVVTVEPVHGAQGFVGYQITDVTPGVRAFITPHLRVGDVITHVNGVRLMRPEDYMQAWRSLDKASAIRVDFTRKSEAMNVVWVVE